MKTIWVIAAGEPLPLEDSKDRLHRVGILAEKLSNMGISVVWWTSSVDHFNKKQLVNNTETKQISNNYSIVLIHSLLYKKNISISRILNHIGLAKRFKKLALNYPKPDIILSAFPTIELSLEAVNYGKRNNIPVIIDARDMWPDIFIDSIPKHFQWIGKIIFQPMFKSTKLVFNRASAIVGITEGFVDWGIKYAEREKTLYDRSFYLAYPKTEHNIKDVNNALKKFTNLGVTGKDFIISFVGAISKNKSDLESVIEVIGEIGISYPNLRLVICGLGDDLEYFKSISKNFTNIIFPGWINAVEISTLLAISKLGLAPYRNRNDYLLSIPNKPIEYFSYGLPVLTSLRGELKKIIENHEVGYYYKSKNELLLILARIMCQPNVLNRLSENSASLYKNKFRAEKIYEEYANYLISFKN